MSLVWNPLEEMVHTLALPWGDVALSPHTHVRRVAEEGSWAPRCDVHETDEGLQIHAELPGVRKEDVGVELKDGVMTITGKKQERHETGKEGTHNHRIECRFGQFSRAFAVPEGVQPDHIWASFADGVLSVAVARPAVQPPQTATIAIQ